MAGKRRIPPQLQKHAFKSGSAKAVKAGAKGGRKSTTANKTTTTNKTTTANAKRTKRK